MKSLIILRHADAAGKSPGMSDFDRPLNEQGQAQASAQGRFLRGCGVKVERLIASSALRAQQTAAAVVEARGKGLEVESADELYNVSGDALLEYVRGLADGFSSLLLVAHLPGVAQLVSLLTTEHVDVDLIYSPGTMAAVQMECDSWHDCDYGVGALTLFLPPMLHLP